MNLSALPQEVWKDISFHWLTFPEVIRFDCAATAICNIHFTDMYAEHEFGFAKALNPHSLPKLGVWIVVKKVYLHDAEIPFLVEDATVLWAHFLERTGPRIRKLDFTSYKPNVQLLQATSLHCTSLIELRLLNFVSDSQLLHDILLNNAMTLQSLTLKSVQDCRNAVNGLPNFQNLQKLDVHCYMSDHLDVAALISRCPELVVLQLGGDLQDLRIANAIATSCKNLQRLEVTQLFELEIEYLLIIAAACKNITFLSVFESVRFAPDQLCYSLDCWPQLHTLAYWDWNDTLLEAVAARWESSLRHVDIAGYNIFMTSFCAFTRANPQLTGISIFDLFAGEDLPEDACHVLQYCTLVQHLRIALSGEALHAVLESVALHCPQLQKLDLAQSVEYCPVILKILVSELLPKCPQLQKLMLPAAEKGNLAWFNIPQCNAELTITYEC